jgi:hypothetical protein
MHNFLAMLTSASRAATIVAIAILIVAALGGAVVVSSLIGRIEKLESDLKSLRSDLDHPRVQPLASIVDGGAGLRR